jgi:drug/metabolite transporter (DMT)-like permease
VHPILDLCPPIWGKSIATRNNSDGRHCLTAYSYLAAACTLFAFFAQNFAVRRSSPTRVALRMGSEPAFGALFAYVWLEEQLSVGDESGGGLMVVASVLATVRLDTAGRTATDLRVVASE